jgi:AraC family transcriptional regulator, positive regulator of tynA and feaB
MTASLSTQGIPSRERVEFWVEVATRSFVTHEFASLNGPDFNAELQPGAIVGLGASTFKCDPCQVVRTAQDIARDDADDILLTLQLSGKGCFEQDDRQSVTGPGDFVLVDAHRPFTIKFPEPMSTVAFKLQRDAIEGRLGDTRKMLARKISVADAVGSIVSGFLGMLPERASLLDAAANSQICEQAIDLIALAFSAQVGISGPPQAAQRATALFRLKSVIETNLRDYALKPSVIAAKLGTSVRYANDLLSKEGFSIERYVLHRRLERCRYALEDPTQTHRKIGEIAFAWGFSDLSHFARRFRRAYGTSPGEWRRKALEALTLVEEKKLLEC